MIFLILLSILALISALGVILFRHPVYSALSLISNMVIVSFLYFNMGSEFLALTQLVVYAGAIMVLVVFVIMLLNLNYQSTDRLISRAIIPLIIVTFFSLMIFVLGDFTKDVDYYITSTKKLGEIVIKKYSIPFELTSVLILSALMGAVSLARKKND